MANVAFVRTRIENTPALFEQDEVSEIWVTFPDPQPRPSKAKKRLTSSRFLGYYQKFAKHKCLVHLKTDSQELHEYTKAVVAENKLTVLACTNDLYSSDLVSPILSIKTFYEQMFLDQNKPITYICFELDREKNLVEPILP